MCCFLLSDTRPGNLHFVVDYVPDPLVFPVVNENSRKLNDLIEVKQELYYHYRPLKDGGCYVAHRDYKCPHG